MHPYQIKVFQYYNATLNYSPVKTVTDFLSKHQEIEKVVFCCFDEENYQIFLELCL